MLKLWDKLVNFRSQKGQALLIIVLVMVVAITIGLSVASRTVTNLRTAEDQVNSQKALSAAEAGIEQIMESNSYSTIASSFLNGPNYVTQIATASAFANTNYFLNGGNPVKKSEGDTVWITPYSAESAKLFTTTWSGNLTVYWGSSSDTCSNNLTNTMAAMEIVVLVGPKATPSVKTYGFDPCNGTKAPVSPDRKTSESFRDVNVGATLDTNFGRKTFPYSATIAIAQGLMVRVIPLYADTGIVVKSDVDLPPQGKYISSTGTSTNTQRKITVFQGFPEIPAELFPFNLLILPNE